GTLRNIIECFAAHGSNRGGGAEDKQNLLLTRTNRNLFERSVRDDVALLIGLGEAAPEHDGECRHSYRAPGSAQPRRSARAGGRLDHATDNSKRHCLSPYPYRRLSQSRVADPAPTRVN